MPVVTKENLLHLLHNYEHLALTNELNGLIHENTESSKNILQTFIHDLSPELMKLCFLSERYNQALLITIAHKNRPLLYSLLKNSSFKIENQDWRLSERNLRERFPNETLLKAIILSNEPFQPKIIFPFSQENCIKLIISFMNHIILSMALSIIFPLSPILFLMVDISLQISLILICYSVFQQAIDFNLRSKNIDFNSLKLVLNRLCNDDNQEDGYKHLTGVLTKLDIEYAKKTATGTDRLALFVVELSHIIKELKDNNRPLQTTLKNLQKKISAELTNPEINIDKILNDILIAKQECATNQPIHLSDLFAEIEEVIFTLCNILVSPLYNLYQTKGQSCFFSLPYRKHHELMNEMNDWANDYDAQGAML